MHHQTIQTLATEMFKIDKEFLQVSSLVFFHKYNENNVYCLLSQPDLHIPRINTTLKDIESVQYFGPVIWNNIPIEIKAIKNFDKFKTKIR